MWPNNINDLIQQYRSFWEKLDSIAVESEESDDQVNEKDVHNLIVLLLSHPDPKPFTNKILLDYVGSKGINKAIITETLIKATASLSEAIEKIDDNKAAWFYASEASALLQGMKIDLQLITKKQQKIFFHISLVSAVDMLYGQCQIDDPRNWIKKLFEQQQIEPENISGICPYNRLLLLDYDDDGPIVDFLAYRFQKMFNWARMFLKLINESTQFSNDVDGLKPWKNCGLLAVNQKDIKNLPIIDAIQEKFEPTILFFRDPIASLANVNALGSSVAEKPNRPYLMRINNISVETNSIIINLFFKEITFHTPFGNSVFYFLRPKPDMVDVLNSFSENERRIINELNFLPYLTSMGYKSLDLSNTEYMGFSGLKKVVEIHSFEHMTFEGEIRPFI